VLGELFSREDKKSIPAFQGSSDKLITEWLKAAEHVARNNDWDEDDQKLRFFSDRLKREALLEWHDNYAEGQGNVLNYAD
jgi:hypothetical protein